MNVTRTSSVKVLGRWVRVPNWFITDRKWSVEKIARVEVQAARLGELQKFVVASPLFPLFVAVLFFTFVGVAVGTIEHML